MFQCFVNLALRPLLFCGQTNPTGPNPPHCFDQKTVFVPAVFVLYVPNIPIHNEESICVDMRQPGVYGFRRCKVRHEPTHSPPALCYISLSAPCLYMLPRHFGGGSVVLPRKEHLTGLLVGYWSFIQLLVAVAGVNAVLQATNTTSADWVCPF